MDPLAGDALATLRTSRAAFEKAWDAWYSSDQTADDLDAYHSAQHEWCNTVMRQVWRWNSLLHWAGDDADGAVIQSATVRSPDHSVEVAPSAVIGQGDATAALVWVIAPVNDLRELVDDDWSTHPIDRMEAMLRAAKVSIGIVTDGRWWGLVCANPEKLVASGVVDALTWVEESHARDALACLMDPLRLVTGPAENRLPALFIESEKSAAEITEALGVQVRQAVELLVQAFSEEAIEGQRGGDPDPLPANAAEVYDACVTVMMRVVFLLFAQERGLLPDDDVFVSSYGLAGVLDELQRRSENGQNEEALDRTFHTWHRLLATSRALHGGVNNEQMRMPAYGGSLFSPDRFPWLGDVTDSGALRIRINDRVMMQVLRAVQETAAKGEDRRRISFRNIDVEQIGYIYEGLLGYTSVRADEVFLGLRGSAGDEPEIPLRELTRLAETYSDSTKLAEAIIAWAKEDQPAAKPPTKAALAKAMKDHDAQGDADRILLTVTPDPDLRRELRPWMGIIRRDLRNRPTVFQPGGLVVKETPSRKNSGAHYTPSDLAADVVLHALEPLVYQPGPHQTANRDEWELISGTDILNLKVADIACGSGAFLVAAARYLAARLVEAWHRDESGSTQNLAQDTVSASRQIQALRQVVARCLYGADINAMAVEMCKLSLWLVSLDKNLPFSFVDDKVLHGNSLLGLTTVQQLRTLNIYPSRAAEAALLHVGENEQIVADLKIDEVLEKARTLRRELANEVDNLDPQRSSDNKDRLNRELRAITSDLRLVADAIVGTGLRFGGKAGRALDEAYAALPGRVSEWLTTERKDKLPEQVDEWLTPTVPTDETRWQPLHWILEVPDVMEHGGFDAIIGNPPFLGGQKLTGAMGTTMRDWFVEVLAYGERGSADLVAYFFLRAFDLIQDTGTLGLIATNTLAQGDSRQVGLDQMVRDGFTITHAIQSRKWPVASANLEYAAVWGGHGHVAGAVPRVSDGVEVERISTLLEPAGRVEGHPIRLAENEGIAFQGCILLGMGFILEPDEAHAWIAEDPRNADVLFPYLNGEDLNSRPDGSPSRWVIDFYDRPLESASSYPRPLTRIRELVYAERQKVNRKALRERWWQYAEKRPGMRKAIKGLDEVLVIALVSKTVMPVRVPAGQVFSHALGVFATDSYANQAVLSSSLHQLWAIKYGSGMRNDPRYTPSDVFETFPQPSSSDRLERVGRTLDEERREIMLRRELGLTALYNLVNDPDLPCEVDPDVARMREIHVGLDHAVMEAYSWQDVPLNHGFHTYRQMTRWTVSPTARVEILDRLLEENHRRAADQGAQPRGPAAESDDGKDELEELEGSLF